MKNEENPNKYAGGTSVKDTVSGVYSHMVCADFRVVMIARPMTAARFPILSSAK